MALSDADMSRIRMNMNIMDAVFAIKTLNNLAELQRLIETEGGAGASSGGRRHRYTRRRK